MSRNGQPGVEELQPRTLLSGGLSAAGIPEVHLLAGHRYTGRVATFRDTGLTNWVGKVTVTITWGDGSRREQTTDVRPLGHGLFEVWGTHNYGTARAAPYDLSVQVTERTGGSALARSLFQIVAPSVSLRLSDGPYTHGRPVHFQVSATGTPDGRAPTAYVLEYQDRGEKTWHVFARGSWTGSGRSGGDYVLTSTAALPRAGHLLVRALATIDGIQYPSHTDAVTVG